MQIQGEIAYGYYMQDDWFEDHFNYYNGYINTGEYYNYKRCYFRTKPSKPFSVTVGMQMVTEFGGTATSYSYDRDKGKVNAKEDRYDTTWKDFVRAFLRRRVEAIRAMLPIIMATRLAHGTSWRAIG